MEGLFLGMAGNRNPGRTDVLQMMAAMLQIDADVFFG